MPRNHSSHQPDNSIITELHGIKIEGKDNAANLRLAASVSSFWWRINLHME